MVWDFIPVNGPFGGTTEGPVWDGSGLIFSHIPSSRIYRFDPSTNNSKLYRDQTNHANGLALGADGRLYACEGGARRVVTYDGADTVVLANDFKGSKLNIPNDLAIDSAGRIWFTDPYYQGAGGSWSLDESNRELDHQAVYRIDSNKNGFSIARVISDTTKPNGILFSSDFSELYIAQSSYLPEEKRELRAYPVNEDGTVGEFKVLHDFGPHRGIDGMVLDVEGNIIAAAGFNESGPGPMVYVFSPNGEIIEEHPVPFDRPTNCTFGGTDLSLLYVTTTDGYLLRAGTQRQGGNPLS